MFSQSDKLPKNATPQFGHLKDSALADAVRRLPRWKQVVEFPFLHSDCDVIMLYEMDTNGVSPNKGTLPTSVDSMAKAMKARGFLHGTRHLSLNPPQSVDT